MNNFLKIVNKNSKELLTYSMIISTFLVLVFGWLGVEMKSIHCFIVSVACLTVTIGIFFPLSERHEMLEKHAPLSVEDLTYDQGIIDQLQELQNKKPS